MKLLCLFIALALILGCASTGPQNQTNNQTIIEPAQPAQNITNQTPASNITPPANATLPQGNATLPQGNSPAANTAPPADITPPQNATPNPDEPLAVPTDKSVEQMLNDSIEKQGSEFYMTHSGRFSQTTYRYIREVPGGDSLSFDILPASDVLFDKKPILTIRAIGFTVFQNLDDGSEEAYGAAIFNDTRTVLDNYTGSDTFAIRFVPPVIDKNLQDCHSYTKDFNIDMEKNWLLTYFIKCEKISDK